MKNTIKSSSERESLATSHQTTFLFDVDNTLIDNDAVKNGLDRGIVDLVGEEGSQKFWELYEQVRTDTGLVDIPETMARFTERRPDHNDSLRFALSDVMIDFPYSDYVFPRAPEVLARCRTIGRVAILSDGDSIFQLNKIGKSGLSQAVDGQIMVFKDKTTQFRAVSAAYPAQHFVVVDDKPSILEAAKQHLPSITTVWVKKGHYANQSGVEDRYSFDLELANISDLLASALLSKFIRI